MPIPLTHLARCLYSFGMIQVKLPDGSIREFPKGTRARDVAAAIGPRLAKDAVAARVCGTIVDLDRELPEHCPDAADGPIDVAILTVRDPQSLDVMRHSCAHVMARAVMRLYPGVKLAFGPTIENGFYYDIDSPTPIREEDFGRIEAEMRRVVDAKEPFERFELPSSEAKAFCGQLDQGYKVEHIDGELKKYPTLSFYRQGEFVDLCRGPHIPDAGRIGAFKLVSIAGAYWKNDASRKQLQRLYGTAWFSQKDLDEYVHRVEEAKRRDHRVLGKQLKLFTISDDVGQGMILWMPKGAIVRGILESFIREELLKRGYQPVYTPHIGRLELYRTSGHFPYYRDSQYPPLFLHPLAGLVDHVMASAVVSPAESAPAAAADRTEDVLDQILELAESMKVPLAGSSRIERIESARKWLLDQEGYLLKPMNCPHHIQIYKATPRSYRDLPVRLAEFGTVYRFEQTGELNGMTRVRGFTQDDAHLFCTEEQVGDEFRACIELTQYILKTMALSDYRVRLGFRDPASSKYVGEPAAWTRAEAAILEVAKSMNLPSLEVEAGEAAFYGPKADFVVRDCIGREWQLGTVQLDYNLPERFQLEYTAADNRSHRPAMIHRAPLGSMERFIGILIEHFAGAFPLWLAPIQARVLPISEKTEAYARGVLARLQAAGIRAEADLRAEKIGHKIREAQLEKIPYMLVVGEKEAAAEKVALRERVAGDLGAFPFDEVLERLSEEIRTRRVPHVEKADAGMGGASRHEY
jgi:threonyl-tRNA synthetase